MASTYLSRTPSSAGNQKTFTISTWVKFHQFSPEKFILSSGAYGGSRSFQLASGTNAQLDIQSNSSGVADYFIRTNRVFRDVTGWYHIVVAVDTTQATSTDRVKIYVNGVQETSFSSASYPSLNFDTGLNSTQEHQINGRPSTSDYGSVSHTHYHLIDGIAYDASTFGETDATTGIWKPKTAPSVTYGTNGFFLKFENSANMDLDSSPNNLTFTTSGTLTQTVDTPSNVFATWNPLENYYQSATLSNGNTTIQTGSSQYSPSSSTLGVSSGKWYWEVEYDALSGGSDVAYVGVLSQFATNSTTSLGTNANDYGYYVNGNYYNNNTGTAYGTTYTTGDIIGVALDLDNNKLYFSKNGTWQNSGDPESGATGTGAISITNPTSTTNGAYFPSICDGSSSANATFKTNFGNGYFGTTAVASAGLNGNGAIFEFDCPSGYYALNTKNINTYG
jgi:hypothetical protein